MPVRYPQPYRGDGLPRRSSSKYILREKSLLKRILFAFTFAITGFALGYLIGLISHWDNEKTIFVSVISLIVAVIIYFAKEDLEKIDIHDVDKMSNESEDDES